MTHYHDLVRVRETPEAIIEVCRLCKERIVYRVKDGTVDEKKYLRDHVRDFCQPTGPTARIFREIYGRATALPSRNRATAVREALAEAKEELKSLRRTTFG